MGRFGLTNSKRLVAAATLLFAGAAAAADKPNILVIWGDDIGTWNISHNNRGMMGYKTPSIDRIASEGVAFTDYYGQQSCTAGRAAFLGGNVPVRTGMTKVGLPGAKEGWQTTDVTIATVMKSLGYATGQFGKNHQGDRDEHLPTNHGFDEFFGNLYHLNAEEEPENRDYPRDMVLANGKKFIDQFGPRGVIHSWANADGTQKIEDTGPLTKKRMETVDEETLAAAIDFIKRQHAAGKPFFTWWNATRMHFRTHVKAEHTGIAGPSGDEYHDGMVEHDMMVGQLLKLLDDLGIADKTIVFYSTDNGPHYNTWPDAGTTPFRSEKNSNWEGAYRVPAFVRWPGHFPAGTTVNGIVAHEDWLPTFLAAAGEPDIVTKLKQGYTIGDRTYHVHIDGYDLLPYLTGEQDKSPRRGLIYFSDDCDVLGLRYENWKVVFLEQRCPGTLQIWFEPFTELRAPKIFNLRTDPFERADVTSNTYWDWVLENIFIALYGNALVLEFLDTFKEFPPRSEPASFTITAAVEKLKKFSETMGG